MNNKKIELLAASISAGILAYMLQPILGSLIALVISVALGIFIRTKFFVVGVVSIALWMILFKVFGVIITLLLIGCIAAGLMYFDFFNNKEV